MLGIHEAEEADGRAEEEWGDEKKELELALTFIWAKEEEEELLERNIFVAFFLSVCVFQISLLKVNH